MPRMGDIVAIIPARYGSTRLPGKPLIDLCGKTMIQRVYEQVKKSHYINNVIIATDDDRIEKTVKDFGGEAIITSPNIKSGSDRIAYIAKNLNETSIIVNVQGDEPLIVPEMIDQAIEPLLRDDSINVGTLVKRILDWNELVNSNIPKVILDKDNFAIYFSRSPIPHLRDNGDIKDWHRYHEYYKHFGLYVFRKDFLLQYTSWNESKLEKAEKLEQLRIIENGYKIKAVITEHDSIPIDTPDDVEKVRLLIKEIEGTEK